jgi:hypothetical protein
MKFEGREKPKRKFPELRQTGQERRERARYMVFQQDR